MDIVKEKEFIELSAAERAELGELCSSEEEFNQMKAMFASISAMDWSNPAPKAETKESLDHLFAQKHPKAAPVWYNAPLAVLAPKEKPFYRQPLVQAAAVGLLIFLTYPFVKSNVMTSDTTQIAQLNEEKTPSESKELAKEKEDKTIEADVYKETEVSEMRDGGRENEESIKLEVVSAPVHAEPVPAPRASGTFTAMFGNEATTPEDEKMTRELAANDGVTTPGSTHPDGVFIGEKTEIFSVPASREPAVFDLLTSTF